MTESFKPQREGGTEPVGGSDERWPTEDELREFEEWNRRMSPGPSPLTINTIEEFGYDREKGPTEQDFKALEEWNNRMQLPPLYSFEEYFGYPDPREQFDQ